MKYTVIVARTELVEATQRSTSELLRTVNMCPESLYDLRGATDELRASIDGSEVLRPGSNVNGVSVHSKACQVEVSKNSNDL